MQKITPCLWFDTQAEEAAQLYTSIFKNSKIGTVTRYTEAASKAAHRPVGSVMIVTFELEGQKFMGLNGGPIFPFTEAVSFLVGCEDQAEIDRVSAQLIEGGGSQGPCGWVKDKFGLSWQIIPKDFEEAMGSATLEEAERMMAAVMQMTKFDFAALERARRGD